jgi:uncharacterized protein YggE
MITDKQITTLVRSGVALASFGVILMASFAISELKTMSYIGEADKQISSISVNGDGDSSAVPDMASLTFMVRAEAKLQKTAANDVNSKMKILVDALKAEGLKDNDIKTESYNLSPLYDYIQQVCPVQTMTAQPCMPGKQQLRGYEVSQRIRISMKGKENFENASNFLDIVSKNGATDLSELQFTVEKPEKVQAEAREEAIKEAKSKAEKLADQLGVELVRIVGFYEGGNQPIYSERLSYSKSMDMAPGAAPTLPVGENQYRSSVTITYEIAE